MFFELHHRWVVQVSWITVKSWSRSMSTHHIITSNRLQSERTQNKFYVTVSIHNCWLVNIALKFIVWVQLKCCIFDLWNWKWINLKITFNEHFIMVIHWELLSVYNTWYIIIILWWLVAFYKYIACRFIDSDREHVTGIFNCLWFRMEIGSYF